MKRHSSEYTRIAKGLYATPTSENGMVEEKILTVFNIVHVSQCLVNTRFSDVCTICDYTVYQLEQKREHVLLILLQVHQGASAQPHINNLGPKHTDILERPLFTGLYVLTGTTY